MSKKTLYFKIILTILCLADSGNGQQLSGNTLSLGTSNVLSSSSTGAGMFAVGTQNQISAWGSGAIGNNNIVLAGNSLALGAGNNLGMTGSGSLASMTIGVDNNQKANNSLVVGSSNDLWADTVFGSGSNSLVVGSSNSNIGKQSFIVGWNNHIALVNETGPWVQPENTGLIGTGLISRFNNCLVIGKNNVGTLPPTGAPMPLFIIGNGQSASARSNALVVDEGGNMGALGVITAAPGGDVPMFGQ